jgi:hypothetical protein
VKLPGAVATPFQQPAQIGGAHTTFHAGTSRVIPRVRSKLTWIPVTTQGLRSLDGRKAITRRPWSLPMELNSYISGFVDGEGCFCVSFQPSDRHRFGWEVRPSFSVSQNAERAELLHIIQKEWGCGFIRPDRSDKTVKFEVRNVRNLVDKVLPHFRAFPLISSKQSDFERFARICEAVSDEKHLELNGLEEIVRLAMEMNPSGKRKYVGSEILKSLRPGERIVCAAGNCGST